MRFGLANRLPAAAWAAFGAATALAFPLCTAAAELLPGVQKTVLGAPQIFTFLFVMVGPLNVLGPFSKVTVHADDRLRRTIAFRAFAYALVALLAGAYLGTALLGTWQISVPALTLAGGIILFLVATKKIIAPDPPEKLAAAGERPTPALALSPLAFPTVATPYGVAALILFMVAAPELRPTIIALLVAVLVLDLLAMLFAREILRLFGLPMQILGAVLGVLQAALGIQIILLAIKRLIVGV